MSFRCYYTSATGRAVPNMQSPRNHCYENGMYPSRDIAKAAAEAQCAAFKDKHPERDYHVRGN